MATDALKKLESTAEQQMLSRKERLLNLEDVFKVIIPVQGKHLAIIDDVVTTGATAMCISDTLIRAGARRVDVWTIARTPKK